MSTENEFYANFCNTLSHWAFLVLRDLFSSTWNANAALQNESYLREVDVDVAVLHFTPVCFICLNYSLNIEAIILSWELH